MSLAAGVRLGPYEVLSLLGAGGMGEVYRARDPRLGRDVAVKVLPTAFSADLDRLHRFQQEARAAAALNHPNIVAIYDVSGDEETPYVVSELLDGETLQEWIQHGRLTTDTAVHFASQIAGALDAVHQAGIVHGDLKPSNVMVTKSGVKLLDFGLATGGRRESPARRFGIQGLPADTATITAERKLFGTLPYMAPEQLSGQLIDSRTDIYAFGILLYEMLTGRRPFDGQTVGESVAAIVSGTSRVHGEAHPSIPTLLQRVLSTCLAHDPDDRWQSARDLKRALAWFAEDVATTGATRQSRSNRRSWWLAASVVAMVATGAVILAKASARGAAPVNVTRPIQLEIDPPAGARFSPSASLLSVSPDGRAIAVLVLGADGISHIWIRRLESSDARQVSGTDNAVGPFWSPDSRFLGFFASNTLKIVDVNGGPVQPVCDAPPPIQPTGTWNRDGEILFTATYKEGQGLYRVSTSGGPATPVRIAAEGHRDAEFSSPAFLPDGRHFVYRRVYSNPPTSQLLVGSLDSSDDRLLVSEATNAMFAPPGYLVFRRGDTLLAQSLDPVTMALSDQAAAIARDVGYNRFNGRTMFSVSADTLVYRPQAARQLVWFDRSGHREGAVATTWSASDPALSPDGSRLAVARSDPATGASDVWVMDLRRGVSSRLTAVPGISSRPVWSPDGQRVLFASNSANEQRLFEVDATGEHTALLVAAHGSPRDWSRDGQLILYADARKLFAVSPAGPTVSRALELPFLAPGEGMSVGGATFSPDGRWIAYSSNESGQDQVFIRSFPDGQHKSQISSTGGIEPRWRGDGKELFYLASDGHMVAVAMTAHTDTLEIGAPQPLFATDATGVTLGILGGNQYAVTRDGQRFLVNEPVQKESTTPITVVVNWRAALTP
jgi:serine/threonine protein kinase